MIFERRFQVGWGDLDANAHMGNIAYLNLCATVRMMYFAECGFPATEFARRQIGPVVSRDDVEYFRELRLLDPVRVTLALAGLSEDATRFRIRNEFFREEGRLAARVTSTGGCLDLSARKLVSPPPPIAQALGALSRTDDFALLDGRRAG